MPFYAPTDFTPDRSIGFLARVLNQVTQAALEPALAEEGLTNTQWQVIVLLYFRRGATCAALARDLAHDQGAMTRLIDALESRGWVTRTRHADDRRLVHLALTDAGRDAAERGRARVIECWNRWLDGWEPAEVESLIAMLQRLRATIEASEGCA